MPYKVGVVGVGKLGTYHCNNLDQMKEAELTGVHDLDQSRAQEIAQKFHCQAFTTMKELIQSVDIVGIVVPTTDHLAVAKTALKANKPVFVEKPITSTIAEAEELVRIAGEKNTPVQVGHIERFNPAVQALDGYQLSPRFIESHRLSSFDPRGTDVAVILDLMIHDIDIILSLIDSPVAEIRANGVAVISEEADIANARIEFENGCVANVTASRISQRKMRKMRIFQSDSYFSIDFLQRLTEVFRISDNREKDMLAINLGKIEKGKYKRNIIYEKPSPPETDAMQAEWQAFFKAIESGTRPLVNAKDGLEALRVASCIRDIINKNTEPVNA